MTESNQIVADQNQSMADVGTLIIEKKLKKQKKAKSDDLSTKTYKTYNPKLLQWFVIGVTFIAVAWVFTSLLIPVTFDVSQNWGTVNPFWLGKYNNGKIDLLPSLNGWLIFGLLGLLIITLITCMSLANRQGDNLALAFNWQKRWKKLNFAWIIVLFITLVSITSVLMATPFNMNSYYERLPLLDKVILLKPEDWINSSDWSISSENVYLEYMEKAFGKEFADKNAADAELNSLIGSLNAIFKPAVKGSNSYETIWFYAYDNSTGAFSGGAQSLYGANYEFIGVIYNFKHGILNSSVLNVNGIISIVFFSVGIGFSILFPITLFIINFVQNFEHKTRGTIGFKDNLKEFINRNKQINTMRKEKEAEEIAAEEAALDKEIELESGKIPLVNNSDQSNFEIKADKVSVKTSIDVDKAFEDAKKTETQMRHSREQKRKRKTEVALPDEELSKIFDELDI